MMHSLTPHKHIPLSPLLPPIIILFLLFPIHLTFTHLTHHLTHLTHSHSHLTHTHTHYPLDCSVMM